MGETNRLRLGSGGVTVRFMQRQETWIFSECEGCGVTFRQRDDAGRKRAYHSNACRQRAYRARSGSDGHEARRAASEARRRQREGEERRMYEEAFAREEARRERERQRSYQRRHGTPPPPPDDMAGYEWVLRDRPTDSAEQRKQRRLCYTLVYKGLRPDANPGEAENCLRAAMRKRARFGL